MCVWGRTLLIGETASAKALRLPPLGFFFHCSLPFSALRALLALRASVHVAGRHLQAASVCSLTTVSLSCLQEGQTVWVIFLWKLLIVH